MDYRETIASLAQQVVNKGLDYSQIHVARLESEWSLAYRQEPTNFVADQWFPMISVNQIAGLYPKWAMENHFTNKAGEWRPGSIPPQGELKVDTPGSYVCRRYAFEMPLMADIPYVADQGYSIEQATTNMVTDVLQLNKELVIANSYFKETVWGIDVTGAASGETWSPAISPQARLSASSTMRTATPWASSRIPSWLSRRLAVCCLTQWS